MTREAIVVAGPNGAGKTTFAHGFLDEFVDYVYLSADALAAEIDPADPTRARVQAGRQFFRRVEERVGQGDNIILESTLAGRGARRMLESLKRHGYTVTLVFVFLDSPEVCIHRIRERVLKGGHDVPTADVIRRFFRSRANFWTEYRFLTDRWYLFHNSGESFREVATGRGDDLVIGDEALFRLFLYDFVGRRNESS